MRMTNARHVRKKSPRKSKIYTCGTHFGDTKLVASTTGSPLETSNLISSTFTSVGIIVFSFCSPSLGPTSTILTTSGTEPKDCRINYMVPKL